MRRMRRIAAALFVFGCIAAAASTARAATLDPFRSAAKGDRALDPFRVAQALPLPPVKEEKPKAQPPAKPQPAPNPQPAPKPQPAPTTSTSAPSPSPSPSSPKPAASPPPKACQRDEDCSEGSICKANTCQPIELTTNLFPIYYREGAFREVFLFYWSRSGNPGYTVVFPFYWHFYSPTTDSFVAFPFYWRFQDFARKSDLTVIPP